MADETQDETRWWLSVEGSRRYRARWIVFDLLINHRMIASRIADEMNIGRATVSKHIKSLQQDGFIERAMGLEEHYRQVRKGSVTGTFKAYIEGPQGQLGQSKIKELKSNIGVSKTLPPEATRLPAGVEPKIDLHRLDFQVKLQRNRKGNTIQPPDRSLNEWGELGVKPKAGKRQGYSLMGKLSHRSNWGFWESESIDSPVGTFNVHLKRRWNSIVNESNEEIGIEWGEWSPSIRITGPRVYLSVEEALNPTNPEGRVGSALMGVVAEITQKLGFVLGLAEYRQKPEYGVLIHDPELAEEIVKHRKTNPNMLEMADGITADGSHGLLKEGFVHLDCETPEQAAAQAAPIAAIDHTMNRITEMMEQFQSMTDTSLVAIEEHAVRATDNMSNQLENQLGTIVDQLRYTMEQSIVQMQQNFNAWLDNFATQQQERVDRAIERFERRLRGLNPERPEGQMTLFEWDNDDE